MRKQISMLAALAGLSMAMSPSGEEGSRKITNYLKRRTELGSKLGKQRTRRKAIRQNPCLLRSKKFHK